MPHTTVGRAKTIQAHPQGSSGHRASDTAARLPAQATMEDFSDLFAMHFVTDDEVSDAAAAAARLPAHTETANEESLEHQLVSAMMFQARGPRARGQPRDRQARSPAATSQAQPGRQVASVSHDAHLAEVRLRHVGAQRQQAYKLESKY
jgi:hypothetical protein